jgi:D-apionate oxidoisomerase
MNANQEELMTTIALFGAAGKIGTRISNRLSEQAEYQVLYVEAGEAGLARLRANGLAPTPKEEACAAADVAILAVPDMVLGAVAHDAVPRLRTGALVIALDPAAPHGGELPERADIGYFVVHPCHPPIVNDEVTPEARGDFWGGIAAKQNIVCALMQGPEEQYALGECIARLMFAPVMNAYRVTVEQMALLEPAMSETVILTCMFVMKEAIDEAVRHGVPAEAARAFALGHMNVNVGILFGYINADFSDGAKLAVARAKEQLIRPDWKNVFEPENVLAQVRAITKGRAKG